MKRFLSSLLIGVASLGVVATASEPCSPLKSTLGVFNHLGVGVGVGTNGVSIEAATPVTRWLALRAGFHYMPDISLSTDVDAYYEHPASGVAVDDVISVDCGIGRTQGSVILNFYPIPTSSMFVAVGGYFGGDKLVKIEGHSDAMKTYGGMIEVGDYNIPVDKNGNVRGGLSVKTFRPYVGFGWGRAIPKHLLNFNFEIGAQFEGKPKVYSETGDLAELPDNEATNDFKDVIKYLKVYPSITFRLSGKIF